MKAVFKKRFVIQGTLSVIILLLLVIAGSMYFYGEHVSGESKWGMFVGGLAASLIVAVIQIILSWQEYTAAQKIRGLGFQEYNRDRQDREFYSGVISSAQDKIDILGATAHALLHDFANENGWKDSNILIRAIERGVRVRLLLIDPPLLDDENKTQADEVHSKLLELSANTNTFSFKYMKGPLAHSIFRADTQCIVGPVFPNLGTRSAPSLVVKTGSHYGEKYLEYFQQEWDQCSNPD